MTQEPTRVRRGGNFKLNAESVREIKRKILAGASLSHLATQHGVTYQALYRIARGETWTDVGPKGNLVQSPQTKRRMSPGHRDKIFSVKRRKGLTNAEIAARQGFSESAVARAMRDARLVLAFRVQRFLLTSGSHELAMSEFKIDLAEAETLTSLAASSRIPKWLRIELEDS